MTVERLPQKLFAKGRTILPRDYGGFWFFGGFFFGGVVSEFGREKIVADDTEKVVCQRRIQKGSAADVSKVW